MTDATKPRRGGSRPGAGRKPSPFGPTEQRSVHLTPAMWSALETLSVTTRGNVSVAIETVLRANPLIAGIVTTPEPPH